MLEGKSNSDKFGYCCCSSQGAARSRGGDQEQEAGAFTNILALADLKATPVKADAEQDGLSYRGGETPYGLRVGPSAAISHCYGVGQRGFPGVGLQENWGPTIQCTVFACVESINCLKDVG